MVEKVFLFVLTVFLTSCNRKFREKNELAIPPLFKEEYARYLEQTQQNDSEIRIVNEQSDKI
ncbi:MAG: hypothetical protein LBG48_05305 [Rickettsiales bacterium]|nr:hypothetical protein [Rickettsiales bacterium]